MNWDELFQSYVDMIFQMCTFYGSSFGSTGLVLTKKPFFLVAFSKPSWKWLKIEDGDKCVCVGGRYDVWCVYIGLKEAQNVVFDPKETEINVIIQ